MELVPMLTTIMMLLGDGTDPIGDCNYDDDYNGGDDYVDDNDHDRDDYA